MNIKILSALALVITTGLSFTQAASAQEGNNGSRGMRFNYAPNVWKAEQPRIPQGYNQSPHAVRSGSVPSQNALMGFDPNLLQPAPPPAPPRVAPVANPFTRAVPSVTKVAGNYTPKPSFNPSFGQPAPPMASMPQRPPMQPAQMPTQPQQPVQPIRPTAPVMAKAAPAHVGRPASTGRRHIVRTGVSGRLTAKTNASGSAAAPAQALSYDKGYVPGGSIAASSSVSGRGVGEVSGRLLNHRKKH